MYTLRNLQTSELEDPESLKEELFTQLGNEVLSVSLDFDIGYLVRNEKRWIHNSDDTRELFELLRQGSRVILWCTGINPKSKSRQGEKRARGSQDLETDTGEPLKKKKKSFSEEREERMTELVDKLRECHGTKYSAVQYRLWAEMYLNGTHRTLEEVPRYPMFGQKRRPRGSSSSGQLNEALTGLANSIVSAFSPNRTQQPISSGSSPSKIANLRSKYMEQLSELVKLREIGALTAEEYEEERLTVVKSMRGLNQ